MRERSLVLPDGVVLAWREWGDPACGDVVLCVHGLTRNARDFDALAAALALRFRVICVDLVGRGRSGWLEDKEAYGYPRYLSDLRHLIASLAPRSLRWVGTSVGGLLGMMMAADPDAGVAALVLNDIGPAIPAAALRRIVAYVGQDPRFAGLDDAVRYLREIYAPFALPDEAAWRALAERSTVAADGGGLRLAYDPGLAVPLRAAPIEQDVDLWAVWEAVSCPVLVLRGAASDVLDAETAARMARRAGVTLVEFAGVGHAPALVERGQIEAVVSWLAAAGKP